MPAQDAFTLVEWRRPQEPLRQLPVGYGAAELTAAEQQRLTLGPTVFFTKSGTCGAGSASFLRPERSEKKRGSQRYPCKP
jgi:hypothetical protein